MGHIISVSKRNDALLRPKRRIFWLDKRAEFLYDRQYSKSTQTRSGSPMEALIAQLNAMQRVIQQLMERL